jgi:rare lipoprotein A (peptidoglycan hydrolase)
MVAGVIPAAQAATGGAAPSSESPTASTSDGEGLAFTPLRVAGASWYGPGLYGRKTACGQTLLPNTVGVAHKHLPCGTVVKFVYHGHTLVTQVIDRGPYVRGRAWDLTAAASEALEFKDAGVANLRYAIGHEYARPQG